MSKVQFIGRNGVREFAVLPIELWNAVKDLAEDIEDAALFEQAEAEDDGTRIPAAVLEAELAAIHAAKPRNAVGSLRKTRQKRQP